jgi:BirA family biotin operon repressor/biotin-[acetyl-CoA-carboxylase] ligase
MTAVPPPDSLALAPHLATARLARVVEHHQALASTNDRALELARAGAAHGLAVVADQQTRGRGQRGRSWHSPDGAGLYVSFVTRPQLSPRLLPALTLVAGVALQEALAPVSRSSLAIKWPNDLLVGSGPLYGRKLAGILVEAAAGARGVEHAVIGIGVNLKRSALPAALTGCATSLEALGTIASRAEVLARIAERLEDWMGEAEDRGLERVAERFTRAALGLGGPARLRADGQEREGVLLGVAEDGALCLDTARGREVFYHGELILPGVPRPEDRAP